MLASPQSPKILKIVLFGDIDPEKSRLISGFSKGSFHSDLLAPIAVEFWQKALVADDSEVKPLLWNIDEQKSDEILTNRYKDAHGFAILLDLTGQSSFDDINLWLKEINSNDGEKACKILLGDKGDLREQSASSRQKIREFIKEVKITYFEVCTKTGENIKEAFLYLAREINQTFFYDGSGQDIKDDVGEEGRSNNNESLSPECNTF